MIADRRSRVTVFTARWTKQMSTQKHTHNLDTVHSSVRRHSKTPYESVFHAAMWALRNRDFETADLLRAHLRCVEEGGECQLCGDPDGDWRCELREDTRCARPWTQVIHEPYTPAAFPIKCCDLCAASLVAFGYRRPRNQCTALVRYDPKFLVFNWSTVADGAQQALMNTCAALHRETEKTLSCVREATRVVRELNDIFSAV